MNRLAVYSILFSVVTGMAFSQAVNICGKVTDENGLPLSKTLVRLGQTRFDNGFGMSPYYVTTDQYGNYKLGTGTCAVPINEKSAQKSVYAHPVFVGGKVGFSIESDNLLVKMTLYDHNGKYIKNVMNSKLSRGDYLVSVDNRDLSSQIYLLHVAINGKVSVLNAQFLSTGTAGTVVQNVTGHQNSLNKLAAVVDTLRATEPGYTLGVMPIQDLSGQYNFTLTKNNTWNNDINAFWDTAHVKKQPGHIWYTILNRTGGKIPDSMIYWAIGDNGPPICLKDSNHIDFTVQSSGRLYLHVGYKPVAKNMRPPDKVWDFEEHTNGILNGSLWFHGNTTRVDAYGAPMAYRIHSSEGWDQVRGELYHVFFQSRESFFAEFVNEVPYEFTKLGTMLAPYKIPNPGHNGSDVGPGGKYENYSNKYCAANGVNQRAYLDGIAEPKTSAGAHRHVLGMTAAQQNNDKNYYQSAPANYYSYFLHRRSQANKCYGFPYDDYANGSSYLEHGNITWVEIAVGY